VPDSKPMYGVTIESIEPIAAIIDSLREVSAINRLMTRIVFEFDQKPANYFESVSRTKTSTFTTEDIHKKIDFTIWVT
jgi:hypothetical protein